MRYLQILGALFVSLVIRQPATGATFVIDEVSRSYSVFASSNISSIADSSAESVLGESRSDKVERRVGGVTVGAATINALDLQVANNTYTISAETFANSWAWLVTEHSNCSDCLSEAEAIVDLVGNFDFSSSSTPTALVFFGQQHDPLGDSNTGTLILTNANEEVLFQQSLEKLAASFAVRITARAPVELGLTMRSVSSQEDPTANNTDTNSQTFALSFAETNADLDGDGSLGVGDIDLLTQKFNEGSSDLFFDINMDGLIDQEDRRMWVEDIAGTYFGDADFDGTVDFIDFLALSVNFGKDGGWAAGNFDGVRGVEFPDFLLLSASFGKTVLPPAAPVPEPDILFPAVLGLIFVGLRQHARQAYGESSSSISAENSTAS